MKADSLQLEKELLYFAWPPTLKLSDWWGLKLHFDRVTHKVVCSLFQFHSYSSASIAQLIIHTLSTHSHVKYSEPGIKKQKGWWGATWSRRFRSHHKWLTFLPQWGPLVREYVWSERKSSLLDHECIKAVRQDTICANQFFWTLSQLHRSMTDNNICINYSTASKILILVSLILHQLLYQSAESFRSMIYKLATTYALKMTKER